jgi:hypothetical protein
MSSALQKCMSVAAAILMIGTLAFGGLLHNVVPHEHEHPTTWNALHGALQSEEKKLMALPALLVSFDAATFAAVSLLLTWVVLRARVIRAERREMIALRRGVLPYRRFR